MDLQNCLHWLHLEPTHRQLGQPHYQWRRRVHKITSDVLRHGTDHLYSNSSVVRCVCVCVLGWVGGGREECGDVVERSVCHQCAYSTAGIHQCAYCVAGIHQCAYSVAGIHQCAYSIAGIHQCTYSVAGIHQCAYSIAGIHQCA
jgi:hypothetical protein